MKKKVIILIFICVLSLSNLVANFDYQFDLFSLNPLHKEYFADRGRADMSIVSQIYLEGFPDRVLQDVIVNDPSYTHEVKVWEFSRDISSTNTMMEIKIGETISLFRNTFTFDNFLSPIAFDFSVQALLQSFYADNFNEGIGYDGIYFFGGTFRIGDKISMRIGKHHYCSHYGDSIFKSIQHDFNEFNVGYKYIRMNAYVLGLSIEPTPNIRVYGEINFPPKDILVLRPNMFAPNWRLSGGSLINPDYPDSYKDRIVNIGVELSYPIFKKLGNTTIGYDLHMYEEGKVIYDHVNGGPVIFDEDAPWELEHNIVIAQDISDSVSLEINYHNGRSPFNNFYFLHSSYIGISFRFNPDNTATIFRTKNSK